LTPCKRRETMEADAAPLGGEAWMGWTDMETGMRWFVAGWAGLTVFVLGNSNWVYEYGVIDYIPYVCILAIGMGVPSAVRKMGR